MSLVLINLQSNQQIQLDHQNPFIIGRGNVDGCFDKRVSRSHGRITCTVDGKIHLVALHCNPCFFTRNGVPPVQQLNKDEEETLSEGDSLGLLPNAFWFKITSSKEIIVKEEPNKSHYAEVKLEDGDRAVKEEPVGENPPSIDITVPINVKQEPNNNEGNNQHEIQKIKVEPGLNSEGTSAGYGTPEFEKTKRLPLWMYEIDEPKESKKSSNKHTLSNESVQNKRVKLEPDIKIKVDVESENEGDVKNMASTSKPEIKTELQDEPEADIPPQCQGESSRQAESSANKEGYEESVKSPPKRPVCEYEEKCYRKNPQHKLDFSHPGDADYVPYEERPRCQYGAACYRKNERHRVEFWHPGTGQNPRNIASPSSCSQASLASSPLPAKRRRVKVKKQNSDYEDDDEYDLEDPFINDASSDEYVPSGSDSDGGEPEDFDTSQE